MPNSAFLATETNRLALMSATEQTAIEMALHMGCGIETRGGGGRAATKRAASVRKKAYTSILGAFCEGPWGIRLQHPYEPDDITEKVASKEIRIGKYPDEPDYRLDVVTIPIDGARDLVRGHDTGALSVIAAGPSGSFDIPGIQDPSVPGQRYFVFVANRMIPPTTGRPYVRSIVARNKSQSVAEVVREQQLIEQVLKSMKGIKKPQEVTIATMHRDEPKKLHTSLIGPTRLRPFHGSSITATLATCFPVYELDAFVAVLDPAQTIVIAAIARTTGATFHAFPVRPANQSEKKDGKYIVDENTPTYKAEKFACNDHIYVIATGVTEGLFSLDGVRFLGDDEVSVETEILCVRDNSVRVVTHDHNVGNRIFYQFDGLDDNDMPKPVKQKSYDEILPK